MNKRPLLVLIVALLSRELVAQIKTGNSSSVGQTLTKELVIGEEQESTQPEERMAREAKSARYNGGGCNLTIPGRDCFFEHFAPGPLPLIPLKESALALVGRVTKVQLYLSADRTHIYTETTIQIEELFKSPESFSFPPDRTLITDQIGGSMRMASGRVIHDGSVVDFIGKTYTEGRYVFFLRQVHEGKDLAILSAYELRDGKVFKLSEDGSPGKVLLSTLPNQPDVLSDEQGFLQAIRQHDSVDPKPTTSSHPGIRSGAYFFSVVYPHTTERAWQAECRMYWPAFRRRPLRSRVINGRGERI